MQHSIKIETEHTEDLSRIRPGNIPLLAHKHRIPWVSSTPKYRQLLKAQKPAIMAAPTTFHHYQELPLELRQRVLYFSRIWTSNLNRYLEWIENRINDDCVRKNLVEAHPKIAIEFEFVAEQRKKEREPFCVQQVKIVDRLSHEFRAFYIMARGCKSKTKAKTGLEHMKKIGLELSRRVGRVFSDYKSFKFRLGRMEHSGPRIDELLNSPPEPDKNNFTQLEPQTIAELQEGAAKIEEEFSKHSIDFEMFTYLCEALPWTIGVVRWKHLRSLIHDMRESWLWTRERDWHLRKEWWHLGFMAARRSAAL